MLRRTTLAAFKNKWKPVDAMLRGRSRPRNQHRQSVFGSKGRDVKWAKKHGLRDARPTVTELGKRLGGPRLGGGLFGARTNLGAFRELAKLPAADREYVMHGDANITNRLAGKHADQNPLISEFLAAIPMRHRVLFLLDPMAAVSPAAARILAAECAARMWSQRLDHTTREASSVKPSALLHAPLPHECVFVGRYAYASVDMLALAAEKTLTLADLTKRMHHVTASVARKDYVVRSLLNGKDVKASQFMEDWEKASVTYGEMASGASWFELVDERVTLGAQLIIARGLSLSSSLPPLESAAPVRDAVRWWWRNHDPSRPVTTQGTANRVGLGTAHDVSSVVVVPTADLPSKSLQALTRRSATLVREDVETVLRVLTSFAQRTNVQRPGAEAQHDAATCEDAECTDHACVG
jgi:hypothetical protein